MRSSDRRTSTASGVSAQRRRSSVGELPRKGSTRRLSTADPKMWSNSGGTSVGLLPGRATLGPLLLLTLAPPFVFFLHLVLTKYDGSTMLFFRHLRKKFVSTILQLIPSVTSRPVWAAISSYVFFEAILMRIMPGSDFEGPVTPAGHVPIYTANGFQCYCFTLLAYLALSLSGWIDGAWICDNFGQLLASLNVLAFVVCGLLYIKGKYLPSSEDHGSTGNAVFDFYWGTELHPRLLGWDLKHLLTCRVAMMGWPLILLSCLAKQQRIFHRLSHGLLVNVLLQFTYISKFFLWETGYLASIDIMHDRDGFYIIWGVLVFLPCVYTSHSLFLARHFSSMPWHLALLCLGVGLCMIYVNYDCDRQRQQFRASRGLLKVWGKDPLFFEAKYRTETGQTKSSLLLASGYWGLARHFNYVPEVLAALCWTVPVWTCHVLPWLYVPYLALLLLDRAHRDDARCRSKYGKAWDLYCKNVRHLILPQTY